LYFDARADGDQEIDYYDSYGEGASQGDLKAIKAIAEKLNANTYLKYKENRVQQQNNKSSNCGFFAVKFLIDRLNGKHFTDATNWNDMIIDKSKKGEREIEKFKTQVGYGIWKYIPSFAKTVYNVAKEGVARVKKIIYGRTDAPPSVKRLLDKHGDSKIVAMEVARTPVMPVIKTVMNIISSGQAEQNRKRLGYDEIYHLFLIIHLDDGTNFKIERNEDVGVSSASVDSGSQVTPVNIGGKDLSLKQFIENGSKKQGFWTYSPRLNNCQNFVYDLLNGSGLMTFTLKNFIMQDAAALLENMPITESIAKGLTDFKQKLNILVGGGGTQSSQVYRINDKLLTKELKDIEKEIRKYQLMSDKLHEQTGELFAHISNPSINKKYQKLVAQREIIDSKLQLLQTEFDDRMEALNHPIDTPR
jgi:hypothetical protein